MPSTGCGLPGAAIEDPGRAVKIGRSESRGFTPPAFSCLRLRWKPAGERERAARSIVGRGFPRVRWRALGGGFLHFADMPGDELG